MKLDLQKLIKYEFSDPYFFVQFYNLGRGYVGEQSYSEDPHIKRTININFWRIVDDKLQKIDHTFGIFDTETYIIQWIFELIADNAVKEESLFYYWKGLSAYKGFSPLPAEIENQDTIVERIRQWSEPALFFHMYSTPLVVFSGKHEDFNPETTRLFIIRGEIESEVHLFEVPCLKESLRSRAPFLLVDPSSSTIFQWYGASVPIEHKELVSEPLKHIKFDNNWSNFKRVEVDEGQDSTFIKALGSQSGDYVTLKSSTDFTPRLFYLNSITGDFLVTEVEYPLRTREDEAPFPFLQSHLYTASQPAFFLLDNEKEIWLWEGWLTPESNLELYNNELELAKNTAIDYSKEKEVVRCVASTVKHVLAGLEPTEFINIFPYWNKREDITRIQLQKGHTTNVNIIKK